MRIRALGLAVVVAAVAVGASEHPRAEIGKPGLTPVPCPTQEWQLGEAAFEALPGAKAHFGKYDGGLYRIEIPDNWNGDLVLFAHGFVSNAGTNGSMLRVGTHRFRALNHLRCTTSGFRGIEHDHGDAVMSVIRSSPIPADEPRRL